MTCGLGGLRVVGQTALRRGGHRSGRGPQQQHQPQRPPGGRPALGQSHDQIAVIALGGALEDKDPAMQYRAVMSLRQVTGQGLGNDVNKWREYAKTSKLHPAKPEPSLAERIWHPV